MPILVNSDTSQRPSAQQMQSYLASLGASPGEQLMLTGAATSESGRDPGASHDNGIGFGMFGHNGSRLMAMQNFASTNKQDIADWRTQSAFALNELRSRPEGKAAANAQTPEQIALAQMYYERPKGFTEQNPEAGMNYAGRLQTIQSLASGKDPGSTAAVSGGSPVGSSNSGSGVAYGSGAGGPVSTNPGGNGTFGNPAVPYIAPYGNAKLNADAAKMLAGPSSDGFQPLVPYVIGKGASTLFSTLGSLLGGGSPPSQPPSRPAPPPAPSGGAPATSPSQPPGANFSGAGTANVTPPIFAAGPPSASPIVTPTLGPVSDTPTMAQNGNGLSGIASLFGLAAQPTA